MILVSLRYLSSGERSNPMKVKLRVLSGAKEGLVSLRLPTVIGRSAEATIKVRSSRVSRSHCVLFSKGESVWVRDLGSSNGTFVNGRRLDDPCELRVGDLLKVGAVELEVIVELSDTGGERAGEGEVTSTNLAALVAASETVSAPIVEDVKEMIASVAPKRTLNKPPALQTDEGVAVSSPKPVQVTQPKIATPMAEVAPSSSAERVERPAKANEERIRIKPSESAIVKYRETDDGSFISIDAVAIDDGLEKKDLVSPSQIPQLGPDGERPSEDPHSVRIDAGSQIRKSTVVEEDSQLGAFLKRFE